jgi:hypothetical protein
MEQRDESVPSDAARVIHEDQFQLGLREAQQQHSLSRQRSQISEQTVRPVTKDSNAVPCPNFWLLQMMTACLTRKFCIPSFYVLSVLGVAGLFALYAEVKPETEAIRSALFLWYFQNVCYSIAVIVLCVALPAIRRVLLPEQGGLAQLGLHESKISEADKRYLDCWAACCSLFVLFSVLLGCFYLTVPLWDPDRKVLADPFNTERPWDFVTVLHYCTVGLSCITAGPILLTALLSIQVATVLGTDAIDDVMHDLQNLSPAEQNEWAEKVEKPTIRIARHTVVLMSENWGVLVGGTCPLCWALSLSWFIGFLRDPITKWHLLPGSFVAATLPIGVAWPLAAASTRCQKLIDELNEKVLDDLGHHRRIVALEHALRHCNRGQGLSFTVFGVAVRACGLQHWFV